MRTHVVVMQVEFLYHVTQLVGDLNLFVLVLECVINTSFAIDDAAFSLKIIVKDIWETYQFFRFVCRFD